MSYEGIATDAQGQTNWEAQPYFDGKDTTMLKAPEVAEVLVEETAPVDIGKYPVRLLVKAA